VSNRSYNAGTSQDARTNRVKLCCSDVRSPFYRHSLIRAIAAGQHCACAKLFGIRTACKKQFVRYEEEAEHFSRCKVRVEDNCFEIEEACSAEEIDCGPNH